MYKFENLSVWQEGVKLAEQCYELTGQLPTYERSGLSDQLRRAVTSISINIAEGSGSESDKEFSRFLHIARKSLFETIAILKLIEKIHQNKIDVKYYEQCDLVGKLLNGLIKKLSVI